MALWDRVEVNRRFGGTQAAIRTVEACAESEVKFAPANYLYLYSEIHIVLSLKKATAIESLRSFYFPH
jgi:hypothetical protein